MPSHKLNNLLHPPAPLMIEKFLPKLLALYQIIDTTSASPNIGKRSCFLVNIFHIKPNYDWRWDDLQTALVAMAARK